MRSERPSPPSATPKTRLDVLRNARFHGLSLLELCTLLGFVIWGAKFISRASFLAVDGHRYGGMFDDAYISMRYAWNLAHGLGLVWNPGEHVEGYSNLVTTLLMSVACAVFDPRNAVFAVQWCGVATVLLAGVLIGRVVCGSGSKSKAPSPLHRAVVLFFALAFYPLWYWSLTGMETGLVTLLFAGAVWTSERWRERGEAKHLVAAGVMMGLLCVARPDGVLLALAGILYFARAAYERNPRPAGRHLFLLAAVAALFPLTQLGFRAAYYGDLLPNTYLLKLGRFPLGARIQGGLGFLTPFLPVLLALLAAMLLDLKRCPSRLKVLGVGALVMLAGYQVAVGGDPWPYWRIMTPAIALASAIVANQIWTWAERSPGDRTRPPVRRFFACVLLAGVFAALNWPFWGEASLAKRPYQWYSNVQNVNTAISLAELLEHDATVGVFWAGAIPYYTGLRSIDFLGKCDPVIARRAPDLSGATAWGGMQSVPGHNKYDLEYSIGTLRPTYVQGFKWGRDDLSQWGRAHYDSIQYRGSSLWLLRERAFTPRSTS